MQKERKRISKQERSVWTRRASNLIGQGLYTGGMIGFLILLTGIELEFRVKFFLFLCFLASAIGMALIQSCMEDHYINRLIRKRRHDRLS
ncbi:MAG: hypothetical protein EA357_07660 [Micavibrio sp.]|nr:MAG: hypothetical protein EA357_07660 [Micavibrio sp.]